MPSPPRSQFGIGVTRTNDGRLLPFLVVTAYANGQWFSRRKGSGLFLTMEDLLGGRFKGEEELVAGGSSPLFLGTSFPARGIPSDLQDEVTETRECPIPEV